MKRWWVTLYGPYGSVFMQLDNVSADTLRDMLTDGIDYKLEQFTQEERNALDFKAT